MIPNRFLVLILIAFVGQGCSSRKEEKQAKAPQPGVAEAAKPDDLKPDSEVAEKSKETEASCKQQVVELKAFWAQVEDTESEMTPPWPTGGETQDKRIEAFRTKIRESTKLIADLPKKQQPLLTSGINTAPDKDLFKDCPQGLEALEALGNTAPDTRAATYTQKMSEAIEACDCKIDIDWLKVVSYITVRGPG